jgi:hypothetical protein
LLIVGYDGNPAVVGAVGMLAGFCGTLMTPMAANFNIVPAALLELKDQYAVIKAQIATAIPMLVANILIIYFAAFHEPAEPRHRIENGAHRARPCGARISLQARACAFRRRRSAPAARALPDLLRQLRLAQLRPRLVDPADPSAAVSRMCRKRWRSRGSPIASFTPDKVDKERAYIERPLSRTFERPYGWGWLLYLHLEASRHEDREWAANLEPLARAIAGRFRDYLPILTYPIRSGAHFNTAFALVLALEWADRFDRELAELIRARARHWFGGDRDCPAWEPSGDDFVSPR